MGCHVKGVVLKARIEYLKKHFGEDAFDRLLENLKPETRAALRSGVLISSWYPVELSIEMMEAMDRVFGKGDLKLCRDMGRYSARASLGGVYKGYARENDFNFVNRMTPHMWSQYYDSGRMQTETLGNGKAVTRIHDFAQPHRVLCLGTLGWLEAANGIWGAGKVTVEEKKCRCRGDSCCEYLISRQGRK